MVPAGLVGRQQDGPVLLARLGERTRDDGHRIPFGIDGEGRFRQAQHGRAAAGDLEAGQEGDGTAGITHQGKIGLARLQDIQGRGHAAEGDTS